MSSEMVLLLYLVLQDETGDTPLHLCAYKYVSTSAVNQCTTLVIPEYCIFPAIVLKQLDC